jgi:ABC-type antimicrobial peptide transport system permease subunit
MQGAVLRAVRSVDATVPVSNVQRLQDVVDSSLASRRIGLWLMGSFALLAMMLAATGLFAVMSYLVNDRTREIGVRMALGASGQRILSLVVSQGGVVVLGGAVAGMLLALWLSRLLANQLVGVSVRDPLVFGAAPALLLLTALLAMIVPATRASRTPPQIALRSD